LQDTIRRARPSTGKCLIENPEAETSREREREKNTAGDKTRSGLYNFTRAYIETMHVALVNVIMHSCTVCVKIGVCVCVCISKSPTYCDNIIQQLIMFVRQYYFSRLCNVVKPFRRTFGASFVSRLQPCCTTYTRQLKIRFVSFEKNKKKNSTFSPTGFGGTVDCD